MKMEALEFRMYPDQSKRPHDLEILSQNLWTEIGDFVGRHVWQKPPNIISAIIGKPSYVSWKVNSDCCTVDERLALWLALRISSSHPDLVVRSLLGEEEFLLIEGADFLPGWIDLCDSVENRVFIRNGKFYFVPPKILPRATLASVIELSLNSGFLEHCSAHADFSSFMGEIVSAFPSSIESNWRFVNCQVSADVAKALSLNPQLVSLLVDYCGSRDAKAHSHSPNRISFCVKFSRSLHAKALSMCHDRDIGRLLEAGFVQCRKLSLPFFLSTVESSNFNQAKLSEFAESESSGNCFSNPPTEFDPGRLEEALKGALASIDSSVDDYSSSAETNDSEFNQDELEILETLGEAPELLMRVIEKNASIGDERQNILIAKQLDVLRGGKGIGGQSEKSATSGKNSDTLSSDSDEDDCVKFSHSFEDRLKVTRTMSSTEPDEESALDQPSITEENFMKRTREYFKKNFDLPTGDRIGCK